MESLLIDNSFNNIKLNIKLTEKQNVNNIINYIELYAIDKTNDKSILLLTLDKDILLFLQDIYINDDIVESDNIILSLYLNKFNIKYNNEYTYKVDVYYIKKNEHIIKEIKPVIEHSNTSMNIYKNNYIYNYPVLLKEKVVNSQINMDILKISSNMMIIKSNKKIDTIKLYVCNVNIIMMNHYDSQIFIPTINNYNINDEYYYIPFNDYIKLYRAENIKIELKYIDELDNNTSNEVLIYFNSITRIIAGNKLLYPLYYGNIDPIIDEIHLDEINVDKNIECVICLDELNDSNKCIKCNTCNNIYHCECIYLYKQSTSYNKLCSYCRSKNSLIEYKISTVSINV